MASTKRNGSSGSIDAENRVETRSLKQKREASAENNPFKEISESQKKESSGASRSIEEMNRLETRSFKKKREASKEDPKISEAQKKESSGAEDPKATEQREVQVRVPIPNKRFQEFKERKKREGKSLDASSNSPSSNKKFQRAWGGRNAPRMPNPEDLDAYNKAIEENKLFDIPVSNSGYLINAVQPVRDIKDPLIMELAKKAIKAYNQHWKDEPEYTVMEIEKTNMEWVGSFNYYITFRASRPNKYPVSFQAEVLNDRLRRKVIVYMVRKSGDENPPDIEGEFTDDYFESDPKIAL